MQNDNEEKVNEIIQSTLKTRVETKNGCIIYILRTRQEISAETSAMLQALSSRSLGGLPDHLQKLADKDPERFMEQFYVKYGHDSIADCGTVILFIDNTSMLGAKAIQDNRLYNGQESSTRYKDFSKQQFFVPGNNEKGVKIVEKLRNTYLELYGDLRENLIEKNPETSIKAIEARAFDIARSLLPAGTATNVTWTTTLRKANDNIIRLQHNPIEQIRELADGIKEALQKVYPISITNKEYAEEVNFFKETMKDYYRKPMQNQTMIFENNLRSNAKEAIESLNKQPNAKARIPDHIARTSGTLYFSFSLDYGSWRDLQRHRSVGHQTPLLTFDLGFEQWYVDEVEKICGKERKEELESFLNQYKNEVETLGFSAEEKQYMIAMGYKVTIELQGELDKIMYIAQLRAGETVHPTLRVKAKEIGTYLESIGVNTHIDYDDNTTISEKRGQQDIIQKT